jgi:hypothetical protein
MTNYSVLIPPAAGTTSGMIRQHSIGLVAILSRTMILPSTGLFTLIESLEDPLPHPGNRSELVVKGSKCLTTKQQKKRRQDGRSVRAPNLYLVAVESIDEPISAIPNIGGDPGDFIFVRPVNTWSDNFSDYIAMCHGSLD